ncbi:aminoglycoside-resistance protein [Salmonella enterica subsp. enterica serovar Derby]|uniref:Aminoglycoside-resistance protein n=1 Tax=Salmonella enterica subsp. enterica serovar Daytona TaxID=1962639 RepID=A0A447JH14_SALET|nr:aminoglycoside-resistance protein [Salmonella enterica subsp. enterica serovar Derby]VDY41322.1 aminoglycoside-resistance protein [Salmonella enterica subsp. enterica serovar Daytona]
MTLSIPPSIQCQTEAACRLITRVTGDTLRAIHLYGSAVAGGLKPNSDIDLLVTICQPLTEAQRATLMQELLALSSPPGRRQKNALWRSLSCFIRSWFPGVFHLPGKCNLASG